MSQGSIEPVVGILANSARIDDNDIGQLTLACLRIPGSFEGPGHPFGVVDIHLAPESAQLIRSSVVALETREGVRHRRSRCRLIGQCHTLIVEGSSPSDSVGVLTRSTLAHKRFVMNDSLMRDTGVKRVLDGLTNPVHPASPRALIVRADGEPLWDSGDTTLPLALTGITTLFTLAMVLREIDRGALSLDTTLGEVLPADTVRGLCVVGDDDHSFSITIENLLRHQSGIVDYTRPGRYPLRSLEQQFLDHDRSWTLEQALEIAKHYPGLHIPGSSTRAHLSSTNHLLLGAVLQETTGMSFEQLIQLRIVGSLGLKNTYVYTSEHFDKYFTLSPIYSGSRVVRIPQALASSSADGAIISTPQDTLTFSRALWNGEIFRDDWLPELETGLARSEKSLKIGLGVMVAGARRRMAPIVGYSGIAGCALGVDVERGHHAFLTTFQWSSVSTSFADVSSVLRQMNA